MASEAIAAPRRLSERTGVAASLVRFLAKAPLQILIAAIGLLWLVPTVGLFLTSILPAQAFTVRGWWQIFSKPSLATWSNYDALFHNAGLLTALKTTAYIAVGNTLLVVVVGAMAGYAFAWLDFPGRDWLFIGVIALAMYYTAFQGGGNFGVGSAIAVFLFLLVIPVLALNIRRFKRDV